MKFLSDVKDVKALKKVIAEAQYCVDSATVGTVNAYFMFTDNGLSCDSWVCASEADYQAHARILAYGNSDQGNVLCCNVSKQFLVELFGTGKRHRGRILFVQREHDNFVVVYNKDNPDETECMYMTVTNNAVLVKVLLLLVQELFPSIEATTVSNVLATLTGTENREEVSDNANS